VARVGVEPEDRATLGETDRAATAS
jgi:hypothetical protein